MSFFIILSPYVFFSKPLLFLKFLSFCFSSAGGLIAWNTSVKRSGSIWKHLMASWLSLLTIGAFMPAIFCLIFEFIFILILGFRVTKPSYIPFLIGLKICYKVVPKLTLSDKN